MLSTVAALQGGCCKLAKWLAHCGTCQRICDQEVSFLRHDRQDNYGTTETRPMTGKVTDSDGGSGDVLSVILESRVSGEVFRICGVSCQMNGWHTCHTYLIFSNGGITQWINHSI